MSQCKAAFVNLHTLLRNLLVMYMLVCSSASAHDYTGLTIDGAYMPSDVGTFPLTTDYSWLWYEFLGGARFSWFYGPGTDGGVIFNKSQSHPPYDQGGAGTLYHDPGEMTGEFLFLNEPSVLYNANTGITIDDTNTIDMRNLRLFRGTVEDDIGASMEGNSLVPPVADISSLTEGESGWQVYPDGSYDLFFYTSWLGQPMGIHFTGQTIPALPPTVSGFWSDNTDPGVFVFVFGSNFEYGATQVSIDGVVAPLVQVVTTDMLIFQLPAGVNSGIITVTTPHGSDQSSTSFGNSSGGLEISGVWPGAGAHPGDFVFVFGSGFSSPIIVDIGSINAPLVQVVSDGMVIFIMPDDAVTDLILITTGGTTVSTPTVYTVLP